MSTKIRMAFYGGQGSGERDAGDCHVPHNSTELDRHPRVKIRHASDAIIEGEGEREGGREGGRNILARIVGHARIWSDVKITAGRQSKVELVP